MTVKVKQRSCSRAILRELVIFVFKGYGSESCYTEKHCECFERFGSKAPICEIVMIVVGSGLALARVFILVHLLFCLLFTFVILFSKVIPLGIFHIFDEF